MAAVLPLPLAPCVDHDALERAIDLMRQRRSVRRYAAGALEDGVIERLLHAATLAPSAHNRQPWRFALLRSAQGKERLARTMGERLRHDRLADGDDAAVVEADVARSFARLTGAPAVLLVATSMEHMDHYRDQQRRAAEAAMATQSTAMAVQNLLLAAAAAGVGACWMCAPLFCPEAARSAVALPAHWHPQGLVTLGLPQDKPRPHTRLPLHDVLQQESEA